LVIGEKVNQNLSEPTVPAVLEASPYAGLSVFLAITPGVTPSIEDAANYLPVGLSVNKALLSACRVSWRAKLFGEFGNMSPTKDWYFRCFTTQEDSYAVDIHIDSSGVVSAECGYQPVTFVTPSITTIPFSISGANVYRSSGSATPYTDYRETPWFVMEVVWNPSGGGYDWVLKVNGATVGLLPGTTSGAIPVLTDYIFVKAFSTGSVDGVFMDWLFYDFERTSPVSI